MRIGEAGTAAHAPMPPQFDREMPRSSAPRWIPDVGRRIVEGDQRHSSTPQHRKGRRQSPPSNTGVVRAKARGLGASAREARGDVGHAPDVASSQSPTSPAACDRGRNNPARTALAARSPVAALMPTGSGESTGGRPVGRPRWCKARSWMLTRKMAAQFERSDRSILDAQSGMPLVWRIS